MVNKHFFVSVQYQGCSEEKSNLPVRHLKHNDLFTLTSVVICTQKAEELSRVNVQKSPLLPGEV